MSRPEIRRRAILWGILRDGLIAGALITLIVFAAMWGTAK